LRRKKKFTGVAERRAAGRPKSNRQGNEQLSLLTKGVGSVDERKRKGVRDGGANKVWLHGCGRS